MAIPPEMFPDLLCRLPVKTLLRFRCTSKHFCSVIDAPDFAKLNLQHSVQTHSNQSLIILSDLPLHSLDLRSPDRPVEIQHPLKTPHWGTSVLGSCNGLLCLFNKETEIVLWNMSTRKHHRLPFAPMVFPDGSTDAVHMITTGGFGFGYDSVHDDYKLVRVIRFSGSLGSEVMVYGLKSNSWKMVRGFSYEFQDTISMGVFADGALHWLAYHHGDGEGDAMVVAFDLATEEFVVVPEPLVGPGGSEAMWQLGVWEGRLCVIYIWPGEQVEMWAMKHHGVEESWTRMLSTSKPQIINGPKCIAPLTHLSNGNELLLLKNFQKLIRYDLKKNKVKFARIAGLPDNFDALAYVESLVKPLPLVNVDDEAVGKSKSKSKRGYKVKKNVTDRVRFF